MQKKKKKYERGIDKRERRCIKGKIQLSKRKKKMRKRTR